TTLIRSGYEKYGHIWIVYAKANVNTVQVLEQNWNNEANLPPKLRTDNYYGCAGFCVPKEADSKKRSKKKKKQSKKQMKKLKYNGDEVKGYKLTKRGYKPKDEVINNDEGSTPDMQYHNNLVNAPYSRLAEGIAHSYISGDTVWQALPESRIAWATADEEGNRDYYSFEVCQ